MLNEVTRLCKGDFSKFTKKAILYKVVCYNKYGEIKDIATFNKKENALNFLKDLTITYKNRDWAIFYSIRPVYEEEDIQKN